MNLDDLDQHVAPPPVAARAFPPASWPSKAQLDYVQTAITVCLLALGFSWVLYKLATSPGAIIAGLGRRHVGGS